MRRLLGHQSRRPEVLPFARRVELASNFLNTPISTETQAELDFVTALLTYGFSSSKNPEESASPFTGERTYFRSENINLLERALISFLKKHALSKQAARLKVIPLEYPKAVHSAFSNSHDYYCINDIEELSDIRLTSQALVILNCEANDDLQVRLNEMYDKFAHTGAKFALEVQTNGLIVLLVEDRYTSDHLRDILATLGLGCERNFLAKTLLTLTSGESILSSVNSAQSFGKIRRRDQNPLKIIVQDIQALTYTDEYSAFMSYILSPEQSKVIRLSGNTIIKFLQGLSTLDTDEIKATLQAQIKISLNIILEEMSASVHERFNEDEQLSICHHILEELKLILSIVAPYKVPDFQEVMRSSVFGALPPSPKYNVGFYFTHGGMQALNRLTTAILETQEKILALNYGDIYFENKRIIQNQQNRFELMQSADLNELKETVEQCVDTFTAEAKIQFVNTAFRPSTSDSVAQKYQTIDVFEMLTYLRERNLLASNAVVAIDVTLDGINSPTVMQNLKRLRAHFPHVTFALVCSANKTSTMGNDTSMAGYILISEPASRKTSILNDPALQFKNDIHFQMFCHMLKCCSLEMSIYDSIFRETAQRVGHRAMSTVDRGNNAITDMPDTHMPFINVSFNIKTYDAYSRAIIQKMVSALSIAMGAQFSVRESYGSPTPTLSLTADKKIRLCTGLADDSEQQRIQILLRALTHYNFEDPTEPAKLALKSFLIIFDYHLRMVRDLEQSDLRRISLFKHFIIFLNLIKLDEHFEDQFLNIIQDEISPTFADSVSYLLKGNWVKFISFEEPARAELVSHIHHLYSELLVKSESENFLSRKVDARVKEIHLQLSKWFICTNPKHAVLAAIESNSTKLTQLIHSSRRSSYFEKSCMGMKIPALFHALNQRSYNVLRALPRKMLTSNSTFKLPGHAEPITFQAYATLQGEPTVVGMLSAPKAQPTKVRVAKGRASIATALQKLSVLPLKERQPNTECTPTPGSVGTLPTDPGVAVALAITG